MTTKRPVPTPDVVEGRGGCPTDLSSGVIAYRFNSNDVRTIKIGDTVWFAAPDVCRILGLSNTARALSRLHQDERTTASLMASGQMRQTAMVNESGLIALVLSSRKPEAMTFRRWITQEVLPSIWRTGRYDPSRPATDEALPAGTKPGIYIVIVEQDRRTVVETNGKELYAITDNGLGGIMAGCLVTVQNALEIIASGDCMDGDTSAAKDWLKSAVAVGAEVAGRFIKLRKRQPLEELPPPMARQH